MVGINPGKLREVVAFRTLTRVPNDNGGHDPVWNLAFKTFANVDLEKPVRAVESGQLVNISTRKVLVRYTPSREIDIAMKMEWQGKEYQIVSIDDVDEMKLLVRLTVKRS